MHCLKSTVQVPHLNHTGAAEATTTATYLATCSAECLCDGLSSGAATLADGACQRVSNSTGALVLGNGLGSCLRSGAGVYSSSSSSSDSNSSSRYERMPAR
jgi:hypothetical protein